MDYTPTTIILGYLGFINFITLISFGADKSKAKRGASRTSEARLYFLSLIGGAFGGLLGMFIFRHKTRKFSFKAIMFFMILINLFLYYWIYLNILEF